MLEKNTAAEVRSIRGDHQGMRRLAESLLQNAGNAPDVVVGPLTWQPSDGANSKAFYLIVAVIIRL